MTEYEGVIRVSGKDFVIIFDGKTGDMLSWTYSGKELLAESGSPELNLWRAPLNNDGDYLPKMRRPIVKEWAAAGLDSLVRTTIGIRSRMKNGKAEITVARRAQSLSRDCYVGYVETYDIAPSGEIELSCSLTPVGEEFASFPRVGYMLTVDRSFDRIGWYGYGPEEAYIDRHDGVLTGIYDSTVDEAFVNYVYPQDNGNKHSCRWFRSARIDNPNTHGTGCTLSSAIAANLAKGYTLTGAVERAKDYLSGALAAMLNLGHGSGPLNHAFDLHSRYTAEAAGN